MLEVVALAEDRLVLGLERHCSLFGFTGAVLPPIFDYQRWVHEKNCGKTAKKMGRPRTLELIREIIIRLARETGWGYRRILGELKKLRIHSVSRSTIKSEDVLERLSELLNGELFDTLLEAKVLVERGSPGGRLNTNLNTGTYRGGRSPRRHSSLAAKRPKVPYENGNPAIARRSACNSVLVGITGLVEYCDT